MNTQQVATVLVAKVYPNGHGYQLRYEPYPGGYFSWKRSDGSHPVMGEWNSLLETVAAIIGVESITASNYELYVQKGTAFAWEEIEPYLEEVLALEAQARVFSTV